MNDPKTCKHEDSFHFHENAPPYCPDCDSYPENITENRSKAKKDWQDGTINLLKTNQDNLERKIKELESKSEIHLGMYKTKCEQIKKLKEPEKVLGKYCEAECQRLQFNKQIKELEDAEIELRDFIKFALDENKASRERLEQQIKELEIDNKHLKQDLGATIRVNTPQIKEQRVRIDELEGFIVDKFGWNNLNMRTKINTLEAFKNEVIAMQKDNYGNGSTTHILLHKICSDYETN